MKPIEAQEIINKLPQKKIDQLILMRAEGKSLNIISKELHITKSRVSVIVKHFESEIRNETYHIAEDFREKYNLTKSRRIEFIMGQLDKIYEELDSRNFKKMKTKELLDYANVLEGKLSRETGDLKMETGVEYEVNEELDSFAKAINFEGEIVKEKLDFSD